MATDGKAAAGIDAAGSVGRTMLGTARDGGDIRGPDTPGRVGNAALGQPGMGSRRPVAA